MIFLIESNNRNYKIDADKPLPIAIPMNFNGVQPNAYGVEKASAKPCKAGDLVGDTRRGGSCNFEQVKFIPHCSGTHTESVGHITHERISVHDCLREAFIFANLISVKPEKVSETTETYPSECSPKDRLITRQAIEAAFGKIATLKEAKGLIIRTLPNDESKLSQTYLEKIPAFFSTEAVKFIVSHNIEHLLVDVPSIDRIFDEGKLSNHRIFWNIEQGSFEISAKSSVGNTITELIFVPNEIADGKYLLNLQIAPFVSDASPSRPILFELID